MGHTRDFKQFSFENIPWKFRFNHGGILRNKRRGRKQRPLSSREPIHLVFKANNKSLRRGLRSPLGFAICQKVLRIYAKKFFIKIEQQAICGDHIHLLIRISRRSLAQYFFRVVAGQIAQQLEKSGFLVSCVSGAKMAPELVTGTKNSRSNSKPRVWKYRPFTRVIRGWKPYLIARDYIQLNEKEASGQIKYRPQRLKGVSMMDWELLWK
jgi:REP element-mobilizing transposase RayT